MEYQEARYIRQMPSLSDLIRREAVYGRKGVFGSVKEALKQKFNVKRRLQAKMVGIKEKFDPMYWARSMFGKTGAALYGRAMGRSDADMQYFAGRARPLGGRSYNIGEVPKYRGYEPVKGGTGEGGVASKKMMSVLTDMHKFLVVTQAKETRRRELEANKREGREEEAKRRHKELIEAITGVKQPTATPVEKKEGEGIFGSIKAFVDGLIEKALDSFRWILDFKDVVINASKLLGSHLFRLFLANPAFLAIASFGLLAAFIIGNASAEANQTSAEGLAKAGDVSTEGAAIMATQEPTDENLVQKRKVRLLADRPFSEKSIINPKKDSELGKKYLKEMGFDERTGLTEAEKKQGFNALDDDAQPIKKATPTASKVSSIPQQTTTAGATPTVGGSTPAVTTGASPSTGAMSNAPTTPTPTPVTLATPITTPSTVAAVVSQENASLKTEAKFDAPKETTINNQALNTGKIREDNTIKIAAVRNLEPSFQKMIFDSTRVV